MAFHVIALIAAGAGLTVAGIAIRKKYGDSPPLELVVVYAGITLLGGGYLLVGLAFNHGGGGLGVLITLCAGLLILMPAIVVMRDVVVWYVADFFASALFDSSMVTPMPSDFSRARVKAMQGDVEGALAEYRNYYKEDPAVPRALFAAATYLRKEERFELARDYYIDIRMKFEDNTLVWAEASLRLADVYEHHLNNPKAAAEVLRETSRRARRLKQGRQATERLMGRADEGGEG